jgi:small multidrug resistance pump
MAWIFLSIAILFEVAGTTSMKFSEGFTRLIPSVLIFLFYGVAFTALTLALKRMDLSIAYAVWAGVGTALTAIIGYGVFQEVFTWQKTLCIGLIVVGVVGLRLWGQTA